MEASPVIPAAAGTRDDPIYLDNDEDEAAPTQDEVAPLSAAPAGAEADDVGRAPSPVIDGMRLFSPFGAPDLPAPALEVYNKAADVFERAERQRVGALQNKQWAKLVAFNVIKQHQMMEALAAAPPPPSVAKRECTCDQLGVCQECVAKAQKDTFLRRAARNAAILFEVKERARDRQRREQRERRAARELALFGPMQTRQRNPRGTLRRSKRV